MINVCKDFYLEISYGFFTDKGLAAHLLKINKQTGATEWLGYIHK